MSEKKTLMEGDKYLTISLVGHEKVKAFPNKEKKENEPDFKGYGVGVWVNTVKPKTVSEDLL